MSPSIWFGQGAILDFIAEAQTPTGRLYVDVGTAEGAGTLRDARRLGRLLVRKGFTRERRGRGRRGSVSRRAADRAMLRYLEDAGGRHSEADWARARLHRRSDFCSHEMKKGRDRFPSRALQLLQLHQP